VSRPAERQPPPEIMDLIHAGCDGDRRALESLIRQYQGRVAKFVMQQTRDANHCEDLSQTIFVKMVLALPRLRARERFEPWLFQIARNVCRDHLRGQIGWRRLFVASGASHESIAAPEVRANESDPDIAGALEQLPTEQRGLLEVQLEEKTSYQELARLSGSSVSAVKSRLFRARRSLREFLLAGDAK
jgi:RNA polymerase sigma-70 factor (ECF subfamily)